MASTPKTTPRKAGDQIEDIDLDELCLELPIARRLDFDADDPIVISSDDENDDVAAAAVEDPECGNSKENPIDLC